MSLANYAAGAIMMPYGRFLASAEEYRYSIDRLCGEFGANVEQVAHRFTTLNRPGARGVPFFMLRVDPAGNISKRYAGENFPFSRFGGTCPRWNMHAAFQAHGQVVTQIIETPDGQRYFTVARTIERPIKTELSSGAAGDRARLRHPPCAQALSCADVYDLAKAPATPVGPACAICPRRRLRLSRDAAGGPDAGGRPDEEVDFALPVRRRPRARPAPAPARRGPNRPGPRPPRRPTERTRRACARVGGSANIGVRQDEFAEILVKLAVLDGCHSDNRQAQDRCSCRRTAPPR